MAISSVLNPQNIIGNRKGTAEQFQNFMTGGNGSLGSSVVNSTSLNKIVPFERGGVRPITPDFNSIVSTISTKTDTALNTNIKNQDNKVQGVVNNIQNVFQTTLQNFTKGYQEKLKSIEESKPSGILEKFFGLYNNVTGFIQFFGDKKNLDKISDSLKGLRGLFEDSFETAKLIRKIINKIVKQLSSLPVATPSGGGGFNLDIKVPGSPLKSAAGKMLGGGRGKMLALGAGALGTGMVAGGAINALSGSENIQPAAVQQSIPDNLADSLSSIVDRFVNAIDSLIKSAGGKPKSSPTTSGGGSSGGAPKPSPGLEGPGGAMPKVSGEGTPEQQAMLKSLRFAEGTSKSYGTIFGGNTVKELEEGKLTVQETINMADTGKLPQRLGGGTVPGYGKGSKATGAYQFMPGTLEGLIKNGSLKGDELFTNKVQDRAALQLAANRGVTADLLKKEGFSANVSNKLAPEWASVPTLNGKSYYGQPVKSLSSLQNIYNQSISSPAITTKAPQAQVAPAPTQTKAKADAISQPVKSQSNVTNLSMPPQVSSAGGQSQGGGGGGGSAPPPPSGGSPSVPFLPAGNVDNFLVLYSKMVYNIVDG